MKNTSLDTALMSSKYRDAAIDVAAKRILITDFRGSDQEKDFSEPANCGGLGRIRHFKRKSVPGWPSNPLPIDPARKALGITLDETIRAQVFQNAVCNWRCWYCFVDFKLLAASRKHSRWVTPAELVDLYLGDPNPPPMMDLTGGQPDLTPEWVLWMMEELQSRGIQEKVYLWSDDNLSNDYFSRFLSDAQRAYIARYPKYGRVCCFKGFNNESFAFNTLADASLFSQQFELAARLLSAGIDLYAYVTLTTPSGQNIDRDVGNFIDRLQLVHHNLPLRTVPLQIQVFTPVQPRMNDEKVNALKCQQIAIQAWCEQLEKRFSAEERGVNIAEISIRS